MKQAPLDFDPPPATPYQSGSDTSMRAAAEIEPHAGTQLSDVWEFFKLRGDRGATDDEIEVDLGLRRPSICARRNDLMNRNLIRDSGRTRRTRWGRDATVWVIVGGAHPA